MSRKKEFLYDMEVKKEDGEIVRFSIYKKGRNIYIVSDQSNEHLMHPSVKTIEDEIRIVFNAKVIRKIHPWMDKIEQGKQQKT